MDFFLLAVMLNFGICLLDNIQKNKLSVYSFAFSVIGND